MADHHLSYSRYRLDSRMKNHNSFRIGSMLHFYFAVEVLITVKVFVCWMFEYDMKQFLVEITSVQLFSFSRTQYLIDSRS